MSEHALSNPELPKRALSWLIWTGITALGAFALAGIALNRNEPVSAAWLVAAAICVYLICYRFYSKFIAEKVLQLDDTRITPAERHNDGLDYVPTNRYVVFGHHFAAIAGAGPLVGPVLAAQMGYLPGTLWILVGVVFAGSVQDFVILFCSMRRDGRSLGEMVKMEMGPIAGGVALVGTLGIMIIILAALGLVVVKALGESPWGTFTVAVTIPTAMLMGVYMRSIRPGKVGEASAFGVIVLLLAIWYGQYVAQDATLGPAFTYSAPARSLAIIVYGAIASMLPVWLLLAPRDYISYISGRAGRNGWGPLRNGEDDSAALRRSPASGAPSTRPRSPEALRSARMASHAPCWRRPRDRHRAPVIST